MRESYLRLIALALLITITSCTPKTDKANSRSQCFACTDEDCQIIEAPEPHNAATGGIFEHGEIDLTGDGIPEQVQREGTQVTIIQQNIEVWHSPKAWQVVDVALGDPNDDGRHEVLIVFWREDEMGERTNQPFIIGYRGGYYRELWGGSPVGVPIVEVELADVTGDGRQEIIVLEAVGDTEARTVAVWRWNQWWFNIVWRSEASVYRNLQVGWDAAQTAMICTQVVN